MNRIPTAMVMLGLAACGGTAVNAGSTTGSTGGISATGTNGSSAGSTGASSTSASSTGASSTSAGSTGGSSSSTGSTSTSTSSSSSAGSTGGSTGSAADPNLAGPYTVAELDDSFTVAATSDAVAIHCAYPSAGPTVGPYPVILFGHGFQLPPSEYAAYLDRLASFGYVALTVDFPASFTGVNNVQEAHDLLGGLDWAAQAAALNGLVDVQNAGATGHSLGGKVALLAATMDARVKASITLDPVDGAMNCSATDCPDTSNLMPSLHIPTGFLGETTDATGTFQACAPAADNYDTFYAGTNSPSLEVTVVGANHMSFLDDVSSCGFTCSFCNAATASNAQVHDMAMADVTAFYERYLRGNTAYDAYLTGAAAQSRYVQTGEATILSR